MEASIQLVGFIGLGKMGTPIAENILKAGFELSVYNRTLAKTQPLIQKGARRADTPRQAAEGADVVITCLMDDDSELKNTLGEDGLLAGLKQGAVHIGTATLSPRCAAQLAQIHKSNGTNYLAAPLFGRPDAAIAGSLLTYVAGDEKVFTRCKPLFAAYSGSQIYMGADQQIVNSVKLAMNFTLVSLIELFSEVYTFTEKSGLEAEFAENLMMTVLHHPVLKEYHARLRTRNYEPAAFNLAAGYKDVQLMLQASSDVRAPLHYASVIREKFLTALAQGMENKDWSAVYEVTRQIAGFS